LTSFVTTNKVSCYKRVKFTFRCQTCICTNSIEMSQVVKFSFRLCYQLYPFLPGDSMLYLFGRQYFDQREDCEAEAKALTSSLDKWYTVMMVEIVQTPVNSLQPTKVYVPDFAEEKIKYAKDNFPDFDSSVGDITHERPNFAFIKYHRYGKEYELWTAGFINIERAWNQTIDLIPIMREDPFNGAMKRGETPRGAQICGASIMSRTSALTYDVASTIPSKFNFCLDIVHTQKDAETYIDVLKLPSKVYENRKRHSHYFTRSVCKRVSLGQGFAARYGCLAHHI